jgi:hypothetical protein
LIVFALQLARTIVVYRVNRNLTAIDKTTKRGEYGDSENSKVREQTLNSGRPGELGTSLGESILSGSSCCDHFELTDGIGGCTLGSSASALIEFPERGLFGTLIAPNRVIVV